MIYWITITAISLPCLIIFATRIYGRKNARFKGKAIYVCNHLSNMDPIMLNLLIGKHIGPLSKKELFKNKLQAAFFRALGAIPVDREGTDVAAMKMVFTKLKKGKKLLIFPEGTRNKINEDLQEIKPGAGMFAIKSKTKIVPCCFVKKYKAFRRNVFIVGKPYELSEYYDKKLTPEVLEEAAGKIAKSITDLKEAYLRQLEEKKIVKQIKKGKNKKAA